MPNLTTIIPSRGRIESLRRCVNSAIAYAAEPINVHVYFDDDEACYEAYDPPWGVRKFLIEPRTYYVGVMNMALNQLIAEQPGGLLVTANNDQEFFRPNWDIIAKNALAQNFEDGMGVVEIGDHEGLSFNTFISKVEFWIENYDSELFDPKFKQYFADAHRMVNLESHNWFARLAPGLVQTYATYDEVKAEGLECWAHDDAVR